VLETGRNFRFLALVAREKVSYHWHKASGMKLNLGAWHLSVLPSTLVYDLLSTLRFPELKGHKYWVFESNLHPPVLREL